MPVTGLMVMVLLAKVHTIKEVYPALVLKTERTFKTYSRCKGFRHCRTFDGSKSIASIEGIFCLPIMVFQALLSCSSAGRPES